MSDAYEPPPIPDHAWTPPPPRSGCLMAFMILAGVIMLLPGICSLIFGVVSLKSSTLDPMMTQFILLGLAIGAGGVFLIWAAVRRPRP